MDLLRERVPSFAVQTLIENAVRHGAAPRVAPTAIVVTGSRDGSQVRLSVTNPVDGGASGDVRGGTGLARLRERLAALYGNAARLETTRSNGGRGEFVSILTVPVRGAS